MRNKETFAFLTFVLFIRLIPVFTISSWITCSLTTGVIFYIYRTSALGFRTNSVLQYTAKHSSYVSCFIKFKKDQYECTNNLWIVYSSKYNISSVALLYVIILILNIKQGIYLHYKASTRVRDGRENHSLLSWFLNDKKWLDYMYTWII